MYAENDMLWFEYGGDKYNIFDGWYNKDHITYNFGNYGVKKIYNIKIKNDGTTDKKFI